MDTAPQTPFRIGIYPVPGFPMLSHACTVEPLRAANLLSGKSLYEVMHFAADEGVQSSGASWIRGDHRVGDRPQLDLLLVISGGDPMSYNDAQVFRWLSQMARAGVRIGGVSGGPVVLAKAGLMADRRMTVHWEHGPALAEAFPDLLIERRLYVIDRDRVTCGGGTSPLDLMHALILDQHGAEFARIVSDWFLHTDIRLSAAPQRAGLAERIGTGSGRLLDAVAAMEDHIGDPLSLGQLALMAGVTPRQLNRLFAGRFGTSTMSYYRGLRLEAGMDMLNASTMTVAEIAAATGFANAGHFSRAFTRHFGQAPSEARKRVR